MNGFEQNTEDQNVGNGSGLQMLCAAVHLKATLNSESAEGLVVKATSMAAGDHGSFSSSPNREAADLSWIRSDAVTKTSAELHDLTRICIFSARHVRRVLGSAAPVGAGASKPLITSLLVPPGFLIPMVTAASPVIPAILGELAILLQKATGNAYAKCRGD